MSKRTYLREVGKSDRDADNVHTRLIRETGICVEPVSRQVSIEVEDGDRLVQCKLTVEQARLLVQCLLDSANEAERMEPDA